LLRLMVRFQSLLPGAVARLGLNEAVHRALGTQSRRSRL
jgi:hypothetical protein